MNKVRIARQVAHSNVCSLGVVLFEMAMGRRPFASDSTLEVLKLHGSHRLEKKPARRYRTAREVRLALEGLGSRPSP